VDGVLGEERFIEERGKIKEKRLKLEVCHLYVAKYRWHIFDYY
jgi:hypothetical protein